MILKTRKAPKKGASKLYLKNYIGFRVTDENRPKTGQSVDTMDFGSRRDDQVPL